MKTKKSQLKASKSYKDRFREAGLVRVEVWIKPEHKEMIKRIEKEMRG